MLSLEIPIAKEGYLYTYLSNEAWKNGSSPNARAQMSGLSVGTANASPVYFDDFTVEQLSYIVQVDDYYPFGLSFEQDADRILRNKYLYNGKELQNELQIGWYDYGARMYDPAIGRWGGIDALADDPMQIDKSPYQYAWNSPTNLTDPDGNCPWCVIGLKGMLQEYGTQVAINLIQGQELGDALTNVDGGAIVIAGVQDAATLGIAGIAKQARTATRIANAIDNAGDAAKGADKSKDALAASTAMKDMKAAGENTKLLRENFTELVSTSSRRSGKQKRLREIMDDPKASSADKGWLKNDQRHIDTGNKPALRVPRDGRKSPGQKAEDKGYEFAHPHNSPASQGNNYGGAKLKNHSDHKVETRLHRKRY